MPTASATATAATTSPGWTPVLDAEKGRWDDHITVEVSEASTNGEDPEQGSEELPRESSDDQAKQQKHRLDHLKVLDDHEVHDTLPIPPGVRPLSVRWVDTEKTSRLTARGFEQVLEGDESVFAATPVPATLRILLVMAENMGLSVLVGDCAQAFLQAPLAERNEVWVWPPSEAGVDRGCAWRLQKTLPGLKGGPSAWGDHATNVTTN